jgi:hypothetical protein
VLVEQYSGEDGVRRDIDLRDMEVASLCTSYSLQSRDFDTVFRLLTEDPYRFYALRDLAVTLGQPLQQSVHCARAIETIRSLIAPDLPKSQAWNHMHRALNTTERYVQFVTDNSRALRHGDHRGAQVIDQGELKRRSWIILDRYIEYLKRGRKPLPLDLFPRL